MAERAGQALVVVLVQRRAVRDDLAEAYYGSRDSKTSASTMPRDIAEIMQTYETLSMSRTSPEGLGPGNESRDDENREQERCAPPIASTCLLLALIPAS